MKIFKFIILSLLAGGFVHAELNTKRITEDMAVEQPVVIPMDDAESRKWDFSYFVMSKDHSTVYEWVPRGEKTDSWTKLIQIQFIPLDGDDVNAEQFGKAFVARLKEEAPDAIANITPGSKTRVFVEWSMPTDTKEVKAQDEVSEFISTSDGIYRIAYTEKVPSMDPDVKKVWTKRLSEVKLGQ